MTTNATTTEATTTAATTSAANWSRETEWQKAAAHDKNQHPKEWCLLVRETSSNPVVVSDYGNVKLVDAFARDLIETGIEYGAVIEPNENPPAKIEWDWLTSVQHSYASNIGEALRLADESIPGLVKALIDTAGAMGAECLQRGLADWPTLVATWPTRTGASPLSPADHTYQTLFPTVIARWGIAGNPTPAQAAAIDTKEIVTDATQDLTRADLLELTKILTTAAEQIGLIPDGLNHRLNLRSTHWSPEEALQPPHNRYAQD